jgi:hypothetical protein
MMQRLAVLQVKSDSITSALNAGEVEEATVLALIVKEQVADAIADLRRSADS